MGIETKGESVNRTAGSSQLAEHKEQQQKNDIMNTEVDIQYIWGRPAKHMGVW